MENSKLPPDISSLTDDQFFAFCALNRKLRIERTAEGKIIIMSPTGGETGRRNAEINRQLANWAKQDGTGIVFDSNTEFRLPNGASRSPDASWVQKSRWEALTEPEREKFPPICPDFGVELVSPSDNLEEIKLKMEGTLLTAPASVGLSIPRTRGFGPAQASVFRFLSDQPLFPLIPFCRASRWI